MANKIGIALGGGGTKGFAHIGVISVLLKNGIPIDCVSGCSIGAIIGGIYACGGKVSDLNKYSGTLNKRLLDVTFPRNGLIKGKRIEKMISLMTKDLNFDETIKPFACNAVCLETGKLEIFKEGKLADAILASASMPGVFPPHRINDKTYVDGGVIDRSAVQAVIDLGADFVIAVDVGYKGEEVEAPKRIIKTIERSFEINGWYITQQELKKADKVINVELGNISILGFKHIDETVEKGKLAALQALPEIKAGIENLKRQ